MEVTELPPAARPQWQQTTALITLGAGGVMTGLSLVPKAPAALTSPASLPIRLLAMQRADGPAPGGDAMLRSAIVHVARHFQRLAETRSPAEMEALIWQYASTDGADHGPSCAAFASLALELGSQLAGQQSWVTGGTSYPWPVHPWVDARVDPNPASPGVVSVLQDAQAHGRWRPLGDGYGPKPGDWAVFDGHVEVVTAYQGGVLHTIGGDSGPNLSVNAHEYPGQLQGQGVVGFVDNGLSGPAAPGGHAGRASGVPRQQTASGDLGASYGVSGAAAPTPPGYAVPTTSRSGASRGAGPRPARATAPAGRTGAGHGDMGPARPPGHGASANAGSGPGAPGAVRPVTPAGASAPFLPAPAPRAVPASPAVQRSRYAAGWHALPAQGLQAVSDAGPGSAAPPAPRTASKAPASRGPGHVGTQRPGAGQPAGRGGQASQAGEPSRPARPGKADVPATGLRLVPAQRARPGEAAIPGLLTRVHHRRATSAALAPYHRHDVPLPAPPLPGTAAQQAFIREVAGGAMATQRRYGVPASVTIAQAIDESGWGQSMLATSDHNLFGIKGTGPAGADVQPTQEVINGSVVNTSAPFRVYQDIAQSIDAHGRLLAGSGYYAAAMSVRHDPNAFAAALTGIYATDPGYGTKLIQLMQEYDLYRYDAAAAAGAVPGGAAHTGQGAAPGMAAHGSGAPGLPASPNPARSAKPGSAEIPGIASWPHSPGRVARPGRSPHPGPVPGGHAHSPASSPRARPGAGQADLPGAPAVPHADFPGHQARTAHPDPAVNPAPLPGRSARPGHLPHPAQLVPIAEAAVSSGPSHSPGVAQPPGLADASAYAAIPGLPHARTGQGRPARPRATLRYLGATRPPATIYSSGPSAGAGPTDRRDGVGPGANVRQAVRPAGQPAAAHTSAAAARIGSAGRAQAPAGTARQPAQPSGSAARGNPPWRGTHGGAPGGQHAPPAGGASIPGVRSGSGRGGAAAAGARAAVRAPGGPGGGPGEAAIPGLRPQAGNGPAARAQRLGAAAGTVPGARTAAGAPSATGGVPADRSGAPRGPSASPRPAASAAAGAPAATTAAVFDASPASAARPVGTAPAGTGSAVGTAPASGARVTHNVGSARVTRAAGIDATLAVYRAHLPPPVREAFDRSAKPRLTRAEPLYADVASHAGLRWEILAACDWMQCRARHGHSPVYGERLGALNGDGTCYRTRSAALERCAYDLVELARSVYRLDIATSRELSIRDLANVFAAFRWGGLLRQHNTSAMDFPYSVAGLTADHMHMRWPNIDEPDAPDKPGRRFSQPFGAVPVVIGLNYRALA
jgi:hypothetical protein